jgi:hypothetical protein
LGIIATDSRQWRNYKIETNTDVHHFIEIIYAHQSKFTLHRAVGVVGFVLLAAQRFFGFIGTVGYL